MTEARPRDAWQPQAPAHARRSLSTTPPPGSPSTRGGPGHSRWLLRQRERQRGRACRSPRIRPAASTPATPATAAKEGSRSGRSRRRTVEGMEMRTFGDKQVARPRVGRDSRSVSPGQARRGSCLCPQPGGATAGRVSRRRETGDTCFGRAFPQRERAANGGFCYRAVGSAGTARPGGMAGLAVLRPSTLP